jgi:4-hydroxy-3-polyprenylbenzoate decarboxylase
LVRCQFLGLPEKERKVFLFENCIDVKGKKYNSPVLAAAHAVSTEVYALAMNCKPEEIAAKWEQAQLQPIKTRIVDSGPVQDEIHMGDRLLKHGGLEEFPIPISTPGFDNAPYFSAGNWVSKDPDTGIYNVGNYRGYDQESIKGGLSQYATPAPPHTQGEVQKERLTVNAGGGGYRAHSKRRACGGDQTPL